MNIVVQKNANRNQVCIATIVLAMFGFFISSTPLVYSQPSRTFDGGVTITPYPFAQGDSILISVDITQTYPRRPDATSLANVTQVWLHSGVNVGAAGNPNTRWQKIIGEWRIYPPRCQFTRRTDNTNIFELRLRPSNFWQLQTNELISELCFVLNNGPNGIAEGGAAPPAGTSDTKSDIFIPVTNTTTPTNRPPRLFATLPNQTIQAGQSRQLSLVSYIVDDDGDALSFSVTSSNPNVASVSVTSGGFLTIQGLSAGVASINITANDGRGGTATFTLTTTVTSVTPSCSGTTTFTSSSGSFADRTDGSSSYTNNLDCRWIIQPPAGTASIALSFSRFQTESCCDFVEIYTGTSVTGTPTHRFSGTTIPASVIVNGSAILVRFVTDGSATASGWALNYASSSSSSPVSCSGTTTFTSSSGSFADRTTSSSTYSNNLDCRWLIQPSAGATSISISFSRFNLEQGFDYVEIYSGNAVSGQPLYRFTGTTLPSTVTFSGSAALVRFVSDGSNVGIGWALSYTSSSSSAPASCSGTTTFTSSSGNFADRVGNSSTYSNNLDCRWLIQPSPSATSISISFSSFNLVHDS